MEIFLIALTVTVAVKIYDVIKTKNEEIKFLKITNASLINMAVQEGLIPKKFKVDSPEVKIKIND